MTMRAVLFLTGVALAAGCAQGTAIQGSYQTCSTCHGAPPPAAPDGTHPRVATDLRYCWACHPGTVDSSGRIIPGGLHQDGKVEWTSQGHPDGYRSPAVHGRDFFAFVSGADVPPCAGCHGTDYDIPVAGGESCNSCHAAAGWTGWQGNCSFCHGTKSPATQAGYAVADHPTWSAPPDAISQRLTGAPVEDRTGAHVIHLTGSAYALPFRCDACHQVPTTVAHISGRNARAAVALTAPGQAGPPDAGGWDPGTSTCATACHGAGGSPPWPLRGIACDGCHGVPPATTAHAGLDGSDLTACNGCHPATIAAAGVIDVAGGQHVNGRIDVVGGHAAGFAQPSTHGPQYLDFVAGAPGALNCESCHGTAYTLCTSCHSQPASGGWVAWRTNCTFCHGTRTPAWDGTSVTPASPPDAVAERLSGTPVPARTGKHRSHLNGRVGYPGYACATCHAVPASVSHVRVDRRAPVAFDPAAAFTALSAGELAALPSPLAAYDASANPPTCASNYCHGATLSGGTAAGSPPRWSTAAPGINDCTICHGGPPDTGQLLAADGAYCISSCSVHVWHVQALPAGCDACHHGSAPVNGARLHVNGRADVVFGPGGAGTWDPGAKTCAMACHSDAAARSWR
jgi:predicted CxxxxCH...CXXCH cytochrome family protein